MGEFTRGPGNGPYLSAFTCMIAITITPAAYKALRVMRPETYDAPAGADGMIRIWLDRKFFDRLGQMKAPGESYSGVILRRAKD
jgi:predicted CopG family antitoxin